MIFDNVSKNKIAKVPVIIQMENVECGAASLAMVFAYYGKYIPLEKMRYECDVSRDGVNARNIVEAAKHLGLDGKGYRYSAEKIAGNVNMPCILYWEYNHFVVLTGIKNNKYYINNPARGKEVLTFEQFKKSFSGVVLTFVKTANFVPDGKNENKSLLVIKKMLNFKNLVVAIVAVVVIEAILDLLRPATDRIFIDKMLNTTNGKLFAEFITVVTILTFLQVIFSYLGEYLRIKISGKIDAVSSTSFMWKILHLPMKFFEQRLAGDIQNRFNSNSEIPISLVIELSPHFLSFIKMILYVFIMLRYSILLTFIGVIPMLINIILSRIATEKRVDKQKIFVKEKNVLYGNTVSGLSMIEGLKSSGSEDEFFKKWQKNNINANEKNVEMVENDIKYELFSTILNTLVNILVFFVGSVLIVKGNFSEGMLLAFTNYFAAFTKPFSNMIKVNERIQEMKIYVDRIDDVINYDDDPIAIDRETNDTKFSKIRGNIELKNITFGYSRLSEPLLKDFSLNIKEREVVGIVGRSGCGKSTISKLISGLFVANEGKIFYDGKEITDINRDVFSSSVAVVDQDITIYEDTISDNIRLWDNSIKDFEVILAAKDADVHEVIMKKNKGYEFKLTDNAKELSGGQKQKLEIARALAQDPTILILDEATSALDAKSEERVVSAIKNRGITCIVIAHRLSSIKKCDKIVVIDNGKIDAIGTHDELMKTNDIYKELVISE